MGAEIVLALLGAAALLAPVGEAGVSRMLAVGLLVRGSRFGAASGLRREALAAVAAGSCAALLVAVAGRGAWPAALVTAALSGWAARRWLRGRPRARPPRPADLAAAYDLLAAGLRVGLPVPEAVRVVAAQLAEPTAGVLRRVAELLALGAEPVQAWQPAAGVAELAPLARAARRSASSGGALAETVTEHAGRLRADAGDRMEARSQRAAVLITGPLGLCFLPAFLCLGVVPVVIGLGTALLQQW